MARRLEGLNYNNIQVCLDSKTYSAFKTATQRGFTETVEQKLDLPRIRFIYYRFPLDFIGGRCGM